MLHDSHHRDVDWIVPLVVTVIIATLIAAYFALRLLTAAVTAGARIYVDHGFGKGRLSRVLWWALGGFVALLALCALAFVIIPATVAGDAALACWGFLIFASTVAVCGWKGEQHLGKLGVVDTYLPRGNKRTS